MVVAIVYFGFQIEELLAVRTSITYGNTELFTVLNTGNVGIGTTGPGEKLTIAAGGNILLESGMVMTPYGGFGRYENRITYSEQFDNSNWGGYCGTKDNITANTTDVPAPDGTYTAEKWVVPGTISCGATTSWGVFQSVSGGLVAGQTYTVSIWARGASGGETFRLGLNDTHMVTFTLTTQWKRYTATFTNITATDRGLQFLAQLQMQSIMYGVHNLNSDHRQGHMFGQKPQQLLQQDMD
jgi:hypothetical protein